MTVLEQHQLARPNRAGMRHRVAYGRDAVLLAFARTALEGRCNDRIRLTMPSGATALIGSGTSVKAELTLNSLAVIWAAMRRGGIGFAESYMEGEAETPALGDVIRFYLDNYGGLVEAGKGRFQVRGADKRWHQARANTREGAKRNIADHYDLGNAFYAAWLDQSMTYSSALFTAPGQTLEEAQSQKLDLVARAVGAAPGGHVLEIGCGWGAMAEKLTRCGARVTGITVSKEQLDYSNARLAAAGLADRASLQFQDYRDCHGQYDGIVSIEMIEAVGEEHLGEYFQVLGRCLKPGAAAAIQAITIGEQDYPLYRSRPDFIQRYIFPGGMLPTVGLMREHAARAGLTMETVEEFGASYVQTLVAWRQRFEHSWPKIAALGFDERFRRMWQYYLTYCEAAFEAGVINVGVYRFTKSALNP